MFKKIDVVFQVEHLDRELESYKEVARCIKEKYGLTSVIISNMFHSYYLFYYKPKLVVWNNLTNNKGWPDGFMWEVYGRNIIYVSHRWEQMLTPIGEKFKAPYSEFENNEVKLFAWNNYFKDYLISHGVKTENIFVTGKISNNLLYRMKDKESFFRDKFAKEYNLNTDKQWLFFPMNYSWIYRDSNKIEEMIKRGYDKSTAYILKEYSIKSFEKFQEFLLTIDKEKYEVILRPHPSITENSCKNKLNQNVFINKDYSVREWLLACDIIITSWSTTVYDSYHIQKKSFRFLPYPLPDFFINKSLEIIPVIETIQELEDKIKNYNFKDSELDTYAIDSFSAAIDKLLLKESLKPDYIKSVKYIKNVIKYYIKDMLCKYFKCKYIHKWQTYDWFKVIKIK